MQLVSWFSLDPAWLESLTVIQETQLGLVSCISPGPLAVLRIWGVKPRNGRSVFVALLLMEMKISISNDLLSIFPHHERMHVWYFCNFDLKERTHVLSHPLPTSPIGPDPKVDNLELNPGFPRR